METIISKEEYTENSATTQDIIKKEEELDIKVEALSSESNSQNKSNNLMTLPWNRYYADYYQLQSDVNLHGINFLCPQGFQEKSTLIKEEDMPNLDVEENNSSKDNTQIEIFSRKKRAKAVRVSACKNYISLLCAGFSKIILTAESDCEILKYLSQIVCEKRTKYEVVVGPQSDAELTENIKKYIFTRICGKKVKRYDKNKDFKIRNTEELNNLLIIKARDNPTERFRKEILQGMIDYFFDSSYYDEWLSNGMISENNRYFFVKNKKEIQNKFHNPKFYKPKFNYHSYELS